MFPLSLSLIIVSIPSIGYGCRYSCSVAAVLLLLHIIDLVTCVRYGLCLSIGHSQLS